MPCNLSLNVNGQPRVAQIEVNVLLVDLLREHFGLRGTHQGCDTAQCGACTVLVDEHAIKSCNVLAVQVNGQHIRTIEDLAESDGTLHVMQQVFSNHHALQCGFCTPGFVMRAVAMSNERKDNPTPATPEQVRHALGGNLCRCTGYEGIVNAVCEGLQRMREKASE